MGNVINLKRFKKRIERKTSAKQADTNRALYGRTKSERTSDAKRVKRESDLLEQHRIDDGDAS